MVLAAIRGALGFLSQLPVGRDDDAWLAFQQTPLAFPVAGYLIGALLVLPILLPLPDLIAGLAFVVWLYAITGINHIDGLADLGDALAMTDTPTARREAMTDTTVGVGGVLVVTIAILGLVLAGQMLAGSPRRGALLIITAEVSAKLGLAMLAALATATHDGLGSSFTQQNTPKSLVLPGVIALPAITLTWPHPAATASLGGGILATLLVWRWAARHLGGVSGDVFGGVNEIARLVALYAGLTVWLLY